MKQWLNMTRQAWRDNVSHVDGNMVYCRQSSRAPSDVAESARSGSGAEGRVSLKCWSRTCYRRCGAQQLEYESREEYPWLR